MLTIHRLSIRVLTLRGMVALAVFTALLVALARPPQAHGAAAAGPVLASGFTDTVVTSGLTEPTAAAVAPDGRIFVAEKSGLIKVLRSWSDPNPVVFADLRAGTDDYWDRGLLSIAVDPGLNTGRPYLYALRSYDGYPGHPAPLWHDACNDGSGGTGAGCMIVGELLRFTVAGNKSTNARSLLTGWCQQSPSHSIGTVTVGPDGRLYVGGGDGASFSFLDYGQNGNPCGDPPGAAGTNLSAPDAQGGALRAQSLRRPAGQPVLLSGTILRIDPDTGAAVPGNPYASSSDPNAQRILAYGLRNPFRFAFRPGHKDLWIGDVGLGTYEEIDRVPNVMDGLATAGENFGWPCYEGPAVSGFSSIGLTSCSTLYSGGTATGPYYSYRHDATVGSCPRSGGSSITGLAFENASTFPSAYRNALFFTDSSRGCLWAMRVGSNGLPNPNDVVTIGTGLDEPVQLFSGPGGDIYYVSLSSGTIHRIGYPAGNAVPSANISANVTAGALPLTVHFDARGSTDANGDPLTFSWDLNGNGAFGDSTSATPSATYTTAGPVTVQVRVTDVHGARSQASLRILPGDSPPQPIIDSPASGLHWQVGQHITFSGHAIDGEDGALPPASLSWSLVIHHCPSECHTHRIQDWAGVASGAFDAPDHEYPSWLELSLTATDSQGATATSSVRLDPTTVVLTFDTNPTGLVLDAGLGNATAPVSRTVIVGSTNTAAAPASQTRSGTTYLFSSWSDGGAAAHQILAPTQNATFVATYQVAPP